MRVIVDRAACDGNGLCLRAAPGVFSLDADEVVVVDASAVDRSERESIARAVAVCPKAALGIED